MISVDAVNSVPINENQITYIYAGAQPEIFQGTVLNKLKPG